MQSIYIVYTLKSGVKQFFKFFRDANEQGSAVSHSMTVDGPHFSIQQRYPFKHAQLTDILIDLGVYGAGSFNDGLSGEKY